MNSIVDKIANTIGMPIETINKATTFLAELVAPTLKELSLIPFDSVKEYRYRRQIDILNRTRDYCSKSNIKPKQIELKNIVPLLEYSSLEENEDIFQLWTNLLIASIDENRSHVFLSTYINILKQLSPIEVKILDFIFASKSPVTNKDLKDIIEIDTVKNDITIDIAMTNLMRMQLVWELGSMYMLNMLEDKLQAIGKSTFINEEPGYSSSTVNETLGKELSNIRLRDYAGQYMLTQMGEDFVKICKRC